MFLTVVFVSGVYQNTVNLSKILKSNKPSIQTHFYKIAFPEYVNEIMIIRRKIGQIFQKFYFSNLSDKKLVLVVSLF